MHPQILEICELLTARYVAIEPHSPGDVKRAGNRAEPSRRQGVEQPGIRSGGNHRNTATEYRIDGRRIRAATQAPQRKRPCRSRAPSVDPSWSWFAALNPFCGGSITREMSEGKSTRGSPQTNTGRAGWVEHSERNRKDRVNVGWATARADRPCRVGKIAVATLPTRRDSRRRFCPPYAPARRISLPCGARPASCRLLARPLCPRWAAAFPPALRCAYGSSSPASARRAPPARCDAAPPSG
jgi:hypothetical protein